MSLINDVKAICDHLAPLGWRDLLLKVTDGELDIQQVDSASLRTELAKPLSVINRNIAGFSDFSLDGKQGITPGAPSLSLLYHALASPSVTEEFEGFPSRLDIDIVENYVFGSETPTLAKLVKKAGITGKTKLAIVVFAYEYRPARDTCSRLQADMVFSRTGVARVGTKDAFYDSRSRGFQSEVEENPFAFRVCPAQYGAFLAIRKSGKKLQHMRPQTDDDRLDFWIPIHKLFNGKECLSGFDLQVTFTSFHYNDKIRRTRVHTLDMSNVPATPPFQFSDGIANVDADGLVTPVPHPRLVEPARFNGELLSFKVPMSESAFAALEPGAQVVEGMEVRPAPAYVNARTEVRNGTMIDLNQDSTRPDVRETVAAGDYDALHFTDFTGDGYVDVVVPALSGATNVLASSVPSYSLVAAPDFFPSAGQRELFESVPGHFWGKRPVPLCDTRLPGNLQAPSNRFDPNDKTITAIVPLFGSQPSAGIRPLSIDASRHSCLPDDCAGVYAPGWDVSTDIMQSGPLEVHHLAAYGLGSPFPEDAKLCAALSTFWPTVAPDASRGMSPNTGNPRLHATVAPLTDEEIGQIGTLPWDGVTGPRIITINGQQFAECDDFLHVDYVQLALDGRFSSRLTARVTSDEYARRMSALNMVYTMIGDDRNNRFILSFRKIGAGDPELQQAQIDTSSVFSGPAAYRVDLIFGNVTTQQNHPGDFRKKLLPLTDQRLFLVDPEGQRMFQRRAGQTRWTRAIQP
ncbi:hypothetical protein EI534_07585 [Pseudomonas frederiksbergensis]|nr:hypothetical protein [Pseudomonas frederiksbergensis]